MSCPRYDITRRPVVGDEIDLRRPPPTGKPRWASRFLARACPRAALSQVAFSEDAFDLLAARFGARAMCDHGLIQRFIITIEGPGWSDFEEIELPRLPRAGEPVSTKFGTLLVERTEPTPNEEYGGKIVCRMP
jgi:hypothetical protein